MGVKHRLGWHGVGWGKPLKKIAQTRKKFKNFVLVSSQIVPTVGVEHGHEYRGKGVGEGVHAPKHENAFSMK